MTDPLFECQELTQSFRMHDGSRLTAVNAASLKLQPGETVVVRGASGSGKTTLLMMAAGLLHPQSGRVILDGRDVYSMPSASRNRLRCTKMGVVLPMFYLLPYLSAVKNVALGAPGAAEYRRAAELLERVGLSNRSHQKPDRMSAGECRRLMVARAIVHRPLWILADEPTANLDDGSAQLIRELLGEQVAGGCGLLVVTHDEPSLFQADTVYKMEAGDLRLDVSPRG